ncbi:hypothetical protein [Salinibacter altiplanensis]|uniref:hypothetical protein n=1 Tax=Salinibacter altiplanensis TaxID=1803181 RepID=UPI000C9F63DF|nr:hypothetical protein [Salinibacter altiplanensis]
MIRTSLPTRFLSFFSNASQRNEERRLRTGLLVVAAAVLAVLLANTTQAQDKNMKKMLMQLQEMNQADGYLEAHRDVENPPELLGGPLSFAVEQNSGGVLVGLPDQRELDSDVFGTPEMPLAFTGTPGVTGVPVPFREVENGQFTQLDRPTPFGNKSTAMPSGSMMLKAQDVTATDAATTEDQVKFKASWEDKQGNTYAVRCCEMLSAAGPEFPTFGGVVTNHLLHGFSGVGTPLMPTEYTYAAFWGMGAVLKNGEVVDKPRVVHGMLTEYVRTEGYELASDSEVTPTRKHFHLMVAPFMPVKGEHKFEHNNVSTGFQLPNGKELPFWHVMFENLNIESQRGE